MTRADGVVVPLIRVQNVYYRNVTLYKSDAGILLKVKKGVVMWASTADAVVGSLVLPIRVGRRQERNLCQVSLCIAGCWPWVTRTITDTDLNSFTIVRQHPSLGEIS